MSMKSFYHHDLKSDGSTPIDERVRRENTLISRIHEGDEQAFEELYRHYFPLLANYLMHFVHSRRVAEDLIHNVFFKIWENGTGIEANGKLREIGRASCRDHDGRLVIGG